MTLRASAGRIFAGARLGESAPSGFPVNPQVPRGCPPVARQQIQNHQPAGAFGPLLLVLARGEHLEQPCVSRPRPRVAMPVQESGVKRQRFPVVRLPLYGLFQQCPRALRITRCFQLPDPVLEGGALNGQGQAASAE